MTPTPWTETIPLHSGRSLEMVADSHTGEVSLTVKPKHGDGCMGLRARFNASTMQLTSGGWPLKFELVDVRK
jgi:hypothetical protein